MVYILPTLCFAKVMLMRPKGELSGIIYQFRKLDITVPEHRQRLTLMPFIHMIAVSFSGDLFVMQGKVSFWPKGFSTKMYEFVFDDKRIFRAYINTIFYTASGTLISLAIKEIIFCGFGEPFTRLQDLLEVSKYLKAVSDVKIRINTNGLGNLINKRDVPPLLANTIDSVSISLNASSAEKYLQLTNSIYGMQSYQALLNFAVGCKKYIKEVRLTVVDIVGEEELEQCRKVCDRYDLPLTIRKFR